MTLTPGDDLDETARQRTRDQYALIDEVRGKSIIVDSDDVADFGFICSSDHLLLPPRDPNAPDDPMDQLQDYFDNTRAGEFGSVPDQPDEGRTELSRRYFVPPRTVPAPDGRDLLATLAELDLDFGVGFATPDHLVHICGKGLLCPATEPSETGFSEPWPQAPQGDTEGQGVRVVVIDTGYDPGDNRLLDPSQPDTPENRLWPWLVDVTGMAEPNGLYLQGDELRPYAGHGTFVAGVVKSVAPGCRVHVLNLSIDTAVQGGGVFESDLVDRLYQALVDMEWIPEEERPEKDEPELPDLINMSAGCPTRLNLPPRAFEDWWSSTQTRYGDPDLVLVAAAGNSSNPWPFWPASFDWAVGVGSVDHNGQVSDFSNWGDSVDTYALGRNIVNAFPDGTYHCHETPDREDHRVFTTGRARWSGTSFSAPLVTGLIARTMSRMQPPSARGARDQVLSLPRSADGDLLRNTVKVAPRARPSAWVRVASLP